MKKLIVLLLFILCNFAFVQGQNFPDSLYLHLYNYKIITGEISEEVKPNDLKSSFIIKELIENSNTENFSLYSFYYYTEESDISSFIAIINNSITIYSILSFEQIVDDILNTPLELNIKILLIKKVSEYLSLYCYKGVSRHRMVFLMDYDNFKYIITGSEIKNINGIIKRKRRN